MALVIYHFSGSRNQSFKLAQKQVSAWPLNTIAGLKGINWKKGQLDAFWL